MLLSEQDTIKNGQVNELLKIKLNVGENIEYKAETIKDSVIYNIIAVSQSQKLYHLISWKGYLKDENT